MKSTLNLLDETGLLTVWEIIKLYLRELITTLGGTFENHIHTKNDISDLKNIDNPDKNDGGLMSLDLLTRLNSISLEGIRGISVNNTSLTPNELSVVDITIPVNVSDLPNDAGYLTADDVQGAITASLNTDLTVASEGNGNAVTSISKSESSIIVHKDTTFLTEHQDISGKANVTDVYTKTEADETFLPIGNYLTQHQDISGKANVGDSYTKLESDNKYQPIGNYLTLHQDISGKADKSAAIGSLNLSINPTNFLITLSGTKVDGTSFTVQDVIDLPLESVVVSGSYNNTTKRVVLTLLNGSTIDFSVADLVAGLQSTIDSSHKLSADLVDDTNTTHKFVTASEKTTWNSKYDKPSTGIPSTDMSQAVLTSLGLADTALLSESDPIFGASAAYGITSSDISNWNASDKIFVAEYGTTTANEVESALTAGKIVFCHKGGGYYPLRNKETGEITKYYFNQLDTSFLYTYRLNSLDNWATIITQMELTSNKVTSLSSSSTNTQYPSAKYVYDNYYTKTDINNMLGDINSVLDDIIGESEEEEEP